MGTIYTVYKNLALSENVKLLSIIRSVQVSHSESQRSEDLNPQTGRGDPVIKSYDLKSLIIQAKICRLL